MRLRVRSLSAACAALGLALLAGCGDGGDEPVFPPAGGTQVITLSNRADLVSGGNVLVEIKVPAFVSATSLRVDRDGTDITSQFVTRPNGRIVGLVSGLKNGANVITASSSDNSFAGARLTVTNHPIGGPVLLGSQIQPWVCATPTATAESGSTPGTNASGLSTNAIDAQCNIATEYKFFYRTTNAGCSTALPDPSPPATPPSNACFKPYVLGTTYADLATTTAPNGATVPYVVRVERGTINRGIYDIAVLIDPTKPWTAVNPQTTWSGKVVYTFGASTGQPRRQWRTEQNWADDSALSRGFMVVDNSLTDSLYNSNRVLNAETLMMMKEHIVDNYGEILFTMGNGCSGGSIQQNTAASIYPGLLDGVQVQCDYPDSITTGMEVSDCVLLVNLYVKPEWAALMTGLTQAQINAKKTAINGHLDHLGCQSWNNSFGFNGKPGNYVPTLVTNQTTGAIAPQGASRNNCQLPASMVYDRVTNPNGIRCGDVDASVAVWGTTAGVAANTTRARTTNDNVGIQYGLKALISGAITAEEFVVLNEKIGGFDADVDLTAARSQADVAALDIAYKSGIVASGKNLAKVPIIDVRGYDEQGIHYIWRSYSERDRLDAEVKNHGNQVMWRFGTALTAPAASGLTLMSFLTMDQWLTTLSTRAPKLFTNYVRTQEQVIAGKPAAAVDFCYLTSDTTYSTKITDMAVCDQDARLIPRSSPRQVAGGARTENILKCQLKAIAMSDYAPATLTAAQLARLRVVFPDGVCDWSKSGVGQQDPVAPLTFEAGPGGVPLPDPPQPAAI